jgi:hypothetical protein
MSQEILTRMAKGDGIREVKVSVGEEGFVFDIE